MLVYLGARAFSIREKENFLVFSDFFRFSVEKVPKEQKGSPAGGREAGAASGRKPILKPTLHLSVGLNIPPVNFPRGMNRLTPSQKNFRFFHPRIIPAIDKSQAVVIFGFL